MIMQKQTCAVFIGILLSSCSAKRASFDIRLHARVTVSLLSTKRAAKWATSVFVQLRQGALNLGI
jgi:hypothetical protein